jgi:hypothetical protein
MIIIEREFLTQESLVFIGDLLVWFWSEPFLYDIINFVADELSKGANHICKIGDSNDREGYAKQLAVVGTWRYIT